MSFPFIPYVIALDNRGAEIYILINYTVIFRSAYPTLISGCGIYTAFEISSQGLPRTGWVILSRPFITYISFRLMPSKF